MIRDVVELKEYPGFYEIPGHTGYAISKDGRIFDFENKFEINHRYHADSYVFVNLARSKPKTNSIHRLLGLAFLENPYKDVPLDNLDINHKDGVKTNFNLDNLEWITRRENVLHACRTGLRNDNTPILVKDLRDGSIKRFYSLQECARHFDVNGALIHHYLHKAKSRLQRRYFVFIKEGELWPDLSYKDIELYRDGHPKPIVAKNLETGKRYIFEDMKSAAGLLNLRPDTLRMHIFRYGEKPYHGYTFEFLTDLEEITQFENNRQKLKFRPISRKPVPIEVHNLNSNEKQIYSSVEEFSIAVNAKKNTIQKRIWVTGGLWRNFRITYLNDVKNIVLPNSNVGIDFRELLETPESLTTKTECENTNVMV